MSKLPRMHASSDALQIARMMKLMEDEAPEAIAVVGCIWMKSDLRDPRQIMGVLMDAINIAQLCRRARILVLRGSDGTWQKGSLKELICFIAEVAGHWPISVTCDYFERLEAARSATTEAEGGVGNADARTALAKISGAATIMIELSMTS